MNDLTNEIEKQVVKFDVTEAAIAEMKELYMGLVITDLDDKEQYDAVHQAHMVVRGKRTAVEKKGKGYREGAVAWQKKVLVKENRIVALLQPLESHLKGEKQKVKDEIKRREDAQEALIREKIRRISAVYFDLNSAGTVAQLNIVIDELNAMDIQPTEYFNFTTEAIEKRDEILIIANQNRDTRLRLDAEEAERKAEAEHQAKVAAEQAEIAAKQKAAQDKIDEANRKIEAEKAAIEAEKKAEQERKDREEFERQAKEDARIKAEQDAKDWEEFDRQERAEAEKAAKEAAIKAEMLRPEKEKLEAFAQFLDIGITYPKVESEEARKPVDKAFHGIQKIATTLFEEAQNL